MILDRLEDQDILIKTMALPEPPNNIPRVLGALDPGTGRLSVAVRMPLQLASKYPDKPWGTSIASIGLATKDSNRYLGYTLVDIKPMQGSEDLLWIFEKLDGPIWTTKTIGSPNLIPEKFRSQVSQTKTKQDVVPGTAPSQLIGGITTSIVEDQDNTGKSVKTNISEEITTNNGPLVGEEYGDIVTKSTLEQLVQEGTPAKTGMHIISSIIDPLGNGLAVESTKTVKGDQWPDPVETGVVADGTHNPPPRYLRDLVRTTKKRKIPTVPQIVTLGSNEVAKVYKQETPDRVEEAITTESINLNLSAIDESVQQKPFVKITSVMTPGTEKVLPDNGNGSSQMVWDNGTIKIYENTKEVAEAREGPAGTEKSKKPFVEIITDKKYSISPDISTSSGDAQVVFNDGVIQVYEVSEVRSTGRYGPAGFEQQTKPFVKITSTKSYQASGELGQGEVGSTNKVYDDGDTVVYEKSVDTATAIEGPAGTERDVRPYVSIEKNRKYSANNTISTPSGSAQIVFNDGNTQVYEVEDIYATGRYGPAGVEQQVKPYLVITSTKEYTPTGVLPPNTVGSTNKVYDDGQAVVYESSIEEATAREGLKGIEYNGQQWGAIKSTISYTTSAVPPQGGSLQIVYSDGKVTVYEATETSVEINGSTQDIDPQIWGSVSWNGTFSTSPAGVRSRQVWSNGFTHVYLNEDPVLTITGKTVEVDPQVWGSIEWIGGYASTSSGTKSRKITQIGDNEVYLNENATLKIDSGSFISAREKNPVYTLEEESSYGTEPIATAANSRSRVVFAQGGERVFENIVTTITSTGSRTYGTVVRFSVPSVCLGLGYTPLPRRRGGYDVIFNPIIEEGFEGYFPATVIERYVDAPNGPSKPIITFSPAPVRFATPWGSCSIGPTLHAQLYHGYVHVQDDPTYEDVLNIPLDIPATNYPTWKGVGDVLVGYSCEPFKTGFIEKEVYVTL